jgi:peptidoglycan/LPS O-acetylase OafA/YrhL
MSRVESRDAVRLDGTAASYVALQAQLPVSSDRQQTHHDAINYLPFIDGLRAIAILAVVTYHAIPGLLPGGFAGVDIFFVISGFLITRLINREIREKRFSFPRFLLRRARRLLPAAIACFVLTLSISYFVLLPVAFQDFGRSMVATILMYSNFFYYRISGYFSPQAFEVPLLHTWSLAVEDQFYITWPAILMLMMPRLSRASVLAIVTGILALSLTIAVKTTGVDPEWAFFMLPSRAWELLLGCLLGLLYTVPTRIWPPMFAEIAGYSGLVVVALSLALLDATSPMPGLEAVPICLGVAALIVSSLRHETSVRRALSLQPLVFVGRISYSLYLFHWPLLALATYWLERPLSPMEALIVVAGSITIAVLSWTYIERPFRGEHGRAWPNDRKFILAGASAAAALVFVGNAIKANDGWPWRYDGTVGKLLSQMSSSNPRRKQCDGAQNVFANDEYCNVGSRRRSSYDVALFGDSMANQWAPLLEAASRRNGWAARQVTHGGCAFFPGVELPVKDVKLRECAQYLKQALKFIDTNPGLKLAIVSAYWQMWKPRLDRDQLPRTRHQPIGAAIASYAGPKFENAVLQMIKVFRDRGIKVHIIGPVASQNFRMNCIIRAARDDLKFGSCGIAAEQARASLEPINAIFARAAANDPGVSYSLPLEFMCDSANCSPVIENVFLYRGDGIHLSHEGAELLSKHIHVPSLD